MPMSVSNCNIVGYQPSKKHEGSVKAIAEALAENAKALSELAKSIKPPENVYGIYMKVDE